MTYKQIIPSILVQLHDSIHTADKNKWVGALLNWDILQPSEDGKIIKCYLQLEGVILSCSNLSSLSTCCLLFVHKPTSSPEPNKISREK